MLNNSEKKVFNQTRLRNIKRAKLKQKEAELQYYVNNGYDEKTIHQTMKDIKKLKLEINH